MKTRKALILGATGLVGNALLELLLEDDLYHEVRSYHRRSTGISHSKLVETIGEGDEMDDHPDLFAVDDIFVCVGTTRAKTPNKDTYRSIDLGIPVKAAELGKENGAERILIVSASSADPESKIFYNRLKGEMEQKVSEVGLPRSYFFRPGLILGDRNEKRRVEKAFQKLVQWLDPILPSQYKGVSHKDIARAMVHVARKDSPAGVISNSMIRSFD